MINNHLHKLKSKTSFNSHLSVHPNNHGSRHSSHVSKKSKNHKSVGGSGSNISHFKRHKSTLSVPNSKSKETSFQSLDSQLSDQSTNSPSLKPVKSLSVSFIESPNDVSEPKSEIKMEEPKSALIFNDQVEAKNEVKTEEILSEQLNNVSLENSIVSSQNGSEQNLSESQNKLEDKSGEQDVSLGKVETSNSEIALNIASSSTSNVKSNFCFCC